MNKKRIFRNTILFILACLGIIHVVNFLIARAAEGKGRLTSVSGAYFAWRGDKFFYQAKGSGKPLLLVHDIHPIASAAVWERVIDLLAEKHTVYAIDLAGCGRSSKDNQLYVAFYQVQLILAFIKEIIGEKADIAASHHSAPFIVSAAAFDSSCIDKIILVNPEVPQEMPEEPDFKTRALINALKTPIIGTLLYNLRFSRARTEIDMTEWGFFNPFNVTQEFVDTCFESAHLGGGKGRNLYLSQLGGYMYNDPTAALKRISNPILILFGSVYRERAEARKAYSDIRPDLETKDIGKTGLLPHFEEPEAFTAAVEEFLDDSDAIFAE